MDKITKFFNGKIKEIKGDRITVYVSTATKDRDNEVILPTAWKLENYKKHPILLASHDYHDLSNQIGKAVDFGVDEKGLWATFEYFTEKGNFKADWAFFLTKQGLASFSVGFIPLKSHNGENGVRRVYDEVELLEISQVLVPANPEAVQNDYEKQYLMAIKSFAGNEKMEEKGVIPYKKHPLADLNAEWDAAKEVKQATVEQLKEMCAWYDSSKPDIKSSYKLPHHYVRNYVTVWRAVAAAMAALLGARGGVQIPDKDRLGVYNHLAKHYEEFGKKPPELREYENEEEVLKACGLIETTEKSGRVLSEANRKKIQNAIKALQTAESALKELLAMSEPQKDSSSLGEKEKEIGIEEVLKELKEALTI